MVVLVALFVLGLVFGSFVNALIWRVHKKKDIISGRSQCVKCGHRLAAKDLVPVLSWLALRGRCRYCKKPISWQYPIVEIALGLVFAASYHFWPVTLSGGQWLLFVTWLTVSVGLLAAGDAQVDHAAQRRPGHCRRRCHRLGHVATLQ